MFSILSWNIQQGGGSRVRAIGQAIAKQQANVVILSEFRNNEKGSLLRNALLQAGYRYQFVTAAPTQENSVLIVSNFPANSVLHPSSDTDFPHSILEVQFAAFHVIGVYLPHKKKHKLFDYMQALISQSEKPYIIAGDYNSGINGIDQAGKSFWYEDDMKHFSEIGYIDAFRLKHGQAKEYSWYSHQGNGYRYDHTYIHQSLTDITKSCHYLHDWRETKLSDHSPMLLELGWVLLKQF